MDLMRPALVRFSGFTPRALAMVRISFIFMLFFLNLFADNIHPHTVGACGKKTVDCL